MNDFKISRILISSSISTMFIFTMLIYKKFEAMEKVQNAIITKLYVHKHILEKTFKKKKIKKYKKQKSI